MKHCILITLLLLSPILVSAKESKQLITGRLIGVSSGDRYEQHIYKGHAGACRSTIPPLLSPLGLKNDRLTFPSELLRKL